MVRLTLTIGTERSRSTNGEFVVTTKIMNGFGKLRKRLDEAITYGRFKSAKRIAGAGLKQAREKELPGEIEYFKGQLEILNGSYTQAIKHFDLAVRYNPHDGAAFNDRALCMVELGIIDQAFYYFDRGISVEPDYATVYHNKGWLLNKIGRHSEAVECFKKTLELEPGRAVTYENLADTLANLGDYQGAKENYQKAISLLSDKNSDIKEQIINQLKLIEARLSPK